MATGPPCRPRTTPDPASCAARNGPHQPGEGPGRAGGARRSQHSHPTTDAKGANNTLCPGCSAPELLGVPRGESGHPEQIDPVQCRRQIGAGHPLNQVTKAKTPATAAAKTAIRSARHSRRALGSPRWLAPAGWTWSRRLLDQGASVTRLSSRGGDSSVMLRVARIVGAAKGRFASWSGVHAVT